MTDVLPADEPPVPPRDEVAMPSEEADDGLEKYYTTRYVAQLFEVVTETVTDWIKRGELRAIKIDGGRWRIPKSAIVEFANKRYGIK